MPLDSTPVVHLRRRGAGPVRYATRAQLLRVAAVEGLTDLLRVAVVGEIDAGNAKSFADEVCAVLTADRDDRRTIAVDLSEVDFFGVDGCTALHAINATVMRVDASWSVIPGPEVNRALALCDPAGLIPLTRPEELAEPA